MVPVTLAAGFASIRDNYLPEQLYLLVALSAVLMALTGIIFAEAFGRRFDMLGIRQRIRDRHGDLVLRDVPDWRAAPPPFVLGAAPGPLWYEARCGRRPAPPPAARERTHPCHRPRAGAPRASSTPPRPT